MFQINGVKNLAIEQQLLVLPSYVPDMAGLLGDFAYYKNTQSILLKH